MQKRFNGRVALVTGGSQGIGLAVVQRLVADGATVVTCGRDVTKWEAATAADPSLVGVRFVPTDLTVRAELDALFDTIAKEHGRLDVAVNNASPALTSVGPTVGVDDEATRATIEADLVAPLRCLRRELELMGEHGGSIVNVASVNGLRATPFAVAYASAKHGLVGATTSLAIEYAARGVRVNAVAPGATHTPRVQARMDAADDPDAFRANVEGKVPMGRYAEAQEIANAVCWLASSEASYVTGQVLAVDGGLSQA